MLGPNLLAYWDARWNVTSSLGLVSSWKDLRFSYNCVQAVDASKPTTDGTWVAGDGVADQLTLPLLPAGIPSNAAASWDWCFGEQRALPTAASGCLGAWGGNTSASGRGIFCVALDGVNRARTSVGGASGVVTADNLSVDFTGYHGVLSKVSGTTVETVVDEVGMTPAAVVPVTGVSRIRFFASNNGTATSFGNYRYKARLITRPLTTTQEAQVWAWGMGL